MQAGFFNGAWRATPAGYTLTAGNWYQIVGTYDGTTIKLYVNNSLTQSTSYSGTPTSSGHGIRLMRRWDNADYFDCTVKDINIWNGVMSAAEVAKQHTAYNSLV